MGERLDRTQEVAGSSPASSTTERPAKAGLSFFTARTKRANSGPWSSFGQVDRDGRSWIRISPGRVRRPPSPKGLNRRSFVFALENEQRRGGRWARIVGRRARARRRLRPLLILRNRPHQSRERPAPYAFELAQRALRSRRRVRSVPREAVGERYERQREFSRSGSAWSQIERRVSFTGSACAGLRLLECSNLCVRGVRESVAS